MLQRSSKQNLGFSDGTSQPWAGLKAIPVVHQHSGQLRDVVICYSFLVASSQIYRSFLYFLIFLGILSQFRQNSFTFISGTDSASCGAWVFAWHFSSRHLSFADKWLLFRQSSACFLQASLGVPFFCGLCLAWSSKQQRPQHWMPRLKTLAKWAKVALPQSQFRVKYSMWSGLDPKTSMTHGTKQQNSLTVIYWY